ncbi:MAG: MFS transporter [Clostridia bacterium]|nr:MFS transporter [Clostridia bacterium]
METKPKLSLMSKISYGLGAVGKDMVYMLSASYVLYYFQDVLGSRFSDAGRTAITVAMGVILLVARIFDAFNDPLMGVIVAKTKTRWGKFRPWLLIGTLTNAVILFLMFACPPSINQPGGIIAYAAIFYILWGVTYTMMDIPYWSMIPAFTEGGKEREGLTTLARSCAGVGSAIITILTMKIVPVLGRMFGAAEGDVELVGFKWFALIVAVIFIIFTILTCVFVKEKSTVEMKTVSVKQMFKALVKNDQAMVAVIAIVLINTAIYITSNLVIYFFKYDFGGTSWHDDYVLFNTFGGAVQILSMMLLYPLLRNVIKMSNTKIFYTCLGMGIFGYAVLLVLAIVGMGNVFVLFVPGFFIFAASGLLNILTTVFLANSVDYGLLKNGTSDESVIFSMQTFVVKLASGVAAFAASICLAIANLQSGTDVSEADAIKDFSEGVSTAQKMGLRLTMTIIPIIGLVVAILWFRKKFILTDEKVLEISEQVKELKQNNAE